MRVLEDVGGSVASSWPPESPWPSLGPPRPGKKLPLAAQCQKLASHDMQAMLVLGEVLRDVPLLILYAPIGLR